MKDLLISKNKNQTRILLALFILIILTCSLESKTFYSLINRKSKLTNENPENITSSIAATNANNQSLSLFSTQNWGIFSKLFFGPNNTIWGVYEKTGELYSAIWPVRDLFKVQYLVGTEYWNSYRLLFFNPKSGELYAVDKEKNEMYKGTPPNNMNDIWKNRAIKVGVNTWKDFKQLLFGHDGFYMYGITEKEGKLLAGPIPDKQGNWVSKCKVLANSGWNEFIHVSINTNGKVICVTSRGEVLVRNPPENYTINWVDDAVNVDTKVEYSKAKFFLVKDDGKDVYIVK